MGVYIFSATPFSSWVPIPVENPTPAGWSTHITSRAQHDVTMLR